MFRSHLSTIFISWLECDSICRATYSLMSVATLWFKLLGIIYIYTRDYTRSPVVTMGWFGVGWGGVGMMTFLAHEHIFDATGMMSFLAHEHIFDATEMMSFLAHEHIFDATENWGGVGWGGDDDAPCTWTHLWCYGGAVVPCTWTHLWWTGACKQKRQFGETIQTQVFRARWWQPCRE